MFLWILESMKGIFITTLLLVACSTVILTFFFPVVLFCGRYNVQPVSQEQFGPLDGIDLDNNKCSVYIVFSRYDKAEIPKMINHHNVIYTADNNVLKAMKRLFTFKMTGGDMTTCESKILVYENDKLKFMSAIVVSDGLLGLQGGNFGWAESINHAESIQLLGKFKPLYSPIILFDN